MSSWKAQMRAAEAFQRKLEREAVKRQRELEKLAKERAKLDAIEQARLEVDEFENRIQVLLSIHKDCADPTDWLAAATESPPVPPARGSHYELRARQAMTILGPAERDGWDEKIEMGRLQDERVHEVALQEHAEAIAAWEKRVALARNVRAGATGAYAEVVNELSPLGELTHLGSSTEFIVHSPRLLECSLGLNSSKAVPAEMKSLTAGNKVSTKPIPTVRFHEIYQDYLCSCMLRVARELFALLPIEILLITARTVIVDPRTGQASEQPVLSASISRTGLNGVNFDRIDPSDTIESFPHRGDFKASRKSGAFLPITPLTVAEIMPASQQSLELTELLKRAETLRQEIKAEAAATRGQAEPLSLS
jgi:hypothetical protein